MAMRDEAYTAAFFDCSKPLLRKMRREGTGPRWTKIGRLVRYSDEAIADYIQRNIVSISSNRDSSGNGRES
jgi:hypothetical protein